jgi:hypothetical protein
MDISRGSCFGGVEIGVRVHPDDAKLFMFCRAANRAQGKAVIASNDKREPSILDRCCHSARYPASHGNNTVEILKSGIRDAARLLDGDFDVALIFQCASQLSQFLMKVSISNRTWTHIYAAPIRAEVDGNTDNVYLHEPLLEFSPSTIFSFSLRIFAPSR